MIVKLLKGRCFKKVRITALKCELRMSPYVKFPKNDHCELQLNVKTWLSTHKTILKTKFSNYYDGP